MKKSNLIGIAILVLFSLAFIAAGIYLLWFGLFGSTGKSDCRYVTANLVSCTPFYVEEGDSEGTFMRTQYHCEWQYELAGKSYTVRKDQAHKPASTTTLCTSHWMCTKSSGELNWDALLIGLAALSFGVIGLKEMISSDKQSGEKEPPAAPAE